MRTVIEQNASNSLSSKDFHHDALHFRFCPFFFTARGLSPLDARRRACTDSSVWLRRERRTGVRMAQTITSNRGKIAVTAGAEIVGVQDFAQSVQLIAQRRADAVVNSELAWVDYRKAQPNVPVKVVATTKEGIDVAIPVRKGNPKLLAALNQALDELRAEGVLKALSIKFLGIDVSTK